MNQRQILGIVIMGALPSLLFLLLLVSNDVRLSEFYEPDMYVEPALGLMETGRYIRHLNSIKLETLAADEVNPYYRSETDRMPGYPLLIAAVFSVFGKYSYVELAAIQCLIYGLTVLGVAWGARALRPEWMWPAAAMAALWPNMVIRTAAIMPEVLFMLFFTWGVAALLWAMRDHQRVLRWLLFAGLFFGLAQTVRPAALLLPVFVTPAFFIWLWRSRAFTLLRAAWVSTVPGVLMFLFMLPQFMHVYSETGHIMLTTQGGRHAVGFLYPCMAQKWGCGESNTEAAASSWKLFEQRVEALPPDLRDNRAAQSKIAGEVAFEKLAELPLSQLFTAALGSTVKSLMHSSAYEIMAWFDGKAVYLSRLSGEGLVEKIGSLVDAILENGWALFWVVSMVGVVLTRLIQIGGVVAALRDPQMRLQVTLLILICIPILGVAVGIGNNRYRVPIEPALIYFTLMGAQPLWSRWRNRLLGKRESER